jgi:hypothetical protein
MLERLLRGSIAGRGVQTFELRHTDGVRSCEPAPNTHHGTVMSENPRTRGSFEAVKSMDYPG